MTILKEVLSYAAESLSSSYNIIALVHDRSLLKIDKVTYYEFPDSKKSWIKRLYYEYVGFKALSEKLKPYLWLSLHDITPNVTAKLQAVYCHNASPFYKLSGKDILIDPKFALFNLFYKYLYKINIQMNDFVIVQQQWFRDSLAKWYDISNIIVAQPSIFQDRVLEQEEFTNRNLNKTFTFFYPTLPRFFKNIEVIGEAARILRNKGFTDFEIYLTIEGQENNYARYIHNKYKAIGNIKFIGRLTRKEVFDYYREADCLIFPSKLESWGMPITEFKSFKKPMLLADLEYAQETIGDYEKVKFFAPDNSLELSGLMIDIIQKKLVFERVEKQSIKPPCALNWGDLFNLLLSE